MVSSLERFHCRLIIYVYSSHQEHCSQLIYHIWRYIMRVDMIFLTQGMKQLNLKICRMLNTSSPPPPPPPSPPPSTSSFPPSLRKVTLLEDRESVIHLRNLSLHPANNEEEGGCGLWVWSIYYTMYYTALNWLFIGDTNRVMAEVTSLYFTSNTHSLSLPPCLPLSRLL